MAPKIFSQLTSSTHGGRSFYEQLRAFDDDDIEAGHRGDNSSRVFGAIPAPTIAAASRRNNADSMLSPGSSSHHQDARGGPSGNRGPPIRWPHHDDEGDDDVPASLLVESNKAASNANPATDHAEAQHYRSGDPSSSHGHGRGQWRPHNTEEARMERPNPHPPPTSAPFTSLLNTGRSFDRKNAALWRWVNITNLDSFMRDVYDYYEGGGMWCIMCSNALWLL